MLLCMGSSMLRLSGERRLCVALRALGYRRSCCDPCIFCLMGESVPQGPILIEEDDLAHPGNGVHVEDMAKEAPEDLQVWQVEEHLQQ